jgi:hypothetical protein
MKTKQSLTLLLLITALFSCERIQRKGEAVVNATQDKISETRQRISRKKDQLLDKVFPIYDSGKFDTENNKKRFVEHLQVELTPDLCFWRFYGY